MEIVPQEMFRNWPLLLLSAGAAAVGFRFACRGSMTFAEAEEPDSESPQVGKKNALTVALLAATSLVVAVAIVIHGLQEDYIRRVSYNTVLVAIGGFALLRFAVLVPGN
jgi:hypothetical protein